MPRTHAGVSDLKSIQRSQMEGECVVRRGMQGEGGELGRKDVIGGEGVRVDYPELTSLFWPSALPLNLKTVCT